MRRLVTIILFFGISYAGYSLENDSIVNNIFKLIYNQQFHQAESLLKHEKNNFNNFYSTILQIDLHWWKYSSSKTKEDAKKLKEILKDQAQPNNSINQVLIKSYQMRYERKRYNYIRVLILRSEINQLLSDLSKSQIPIKGRELQLFNFYILMFKYFEEVNPLSFGSSSEKQKQYLTEMERLTREKDLILQTMSHYFLGRIYQKVEKDPSKGKYHFQILNEDFPNNKVFIDHLEDCNQKL